MLKNVFRRFLSLILVVAMVTTLLPESLMPMRESKAATTMDVLVDGLTAQYDGEATWNLQDGILVGNVTGADGCGGSTKTGNISFSNSKDSTAKLQFDYEITLNGGTAKIDGESITANGSYSKELAAGDNLVIEITSDKGAKTTTIKISKLALVTETTATTIFKPAVEGGSYTVNGSEITTSATFTQSSTVPYNVVATPYEGYSFFGWYSEKQQKIIAVAAEHTFNIEKDEIIYPQFVSSEAAIYEVGTRKYLDLNEANEAAKQDSSHQITLVQSGPLPKGTYEISQGVKLLIPFDSAHTANFSDKPTTTTSNVSPVQYSCLELVDGAEINCYGDINVNAQQYAASVDAVGTVSGFYGAIDMNAGSKINLKNKANLYCYGYIGGDGVVEGEEGSNVYQLMQIRDWRGGSVASKVINDKDNNAFLFSQYYLQNIEAMLRLNSGCTVYGSAAISAAIVGVQQACTAIVGKNTGMFHVSSGYAEMKYDAATDRMNLDFYGNLVTDEIALEISTISMNTGAYVLALPMNYTINIHNGSTISFAQKFKLLPGTVINVEEGATATVEKDGAVYLYDKEDWTSANYVYNGTMSQLRYVHARKGAPVKRTINSDAVLKVDGTLIANGAIYSTKQAANGGNATVTGSGTYISNVHGAENLTEITGTDTSTLKIVSVACVPVVGNIVGYSGQSSFGLGTYRSTGDKWYQYKITGTGMELVSGGEAGTDGVIAYVAQTKDNTENMSVVLQTKYPCVKIEGTECALDAQDNTKYVLNNITSDVTANAADHKEEIDEAVEATCTKTGLTAGKHCSVCNKVLEEQKVVAMKEHNYKSEVTKPATCTEDGVRTYTCEVCKDKKTETIPAKGQHTPGEWQVTKEATCTTAGEQKQYCTECKQELGSKEIAALNHIWDEGKVTTEATCATAGEKTYTCTRKGCNETKKEPIPATGKHVLGEWQVETEATCTTDGVKKKYCTTCNQEQERETIKALEHAWDEGKVTKEATCATAGEKTYTCTREGCNETKKESIPATGNHVLGEWTVTTKPTCTTTGVQKKYCTTCNQEQKSETMKALGHSWNEGEVTTKATCTQNGVMTYTCGVCKDTKTEDIPATGIHIYGEWKVTKGATCTEPGEKEQVCTECNVEKKTETINALDHLWNDGEVTKQPTCAEKGIMTYTCKREGCNATKTEDIAATGEHTWEKNPDAESKLPTCTENGNEAQICSVCKETRTVTVSSKGHSPVVDEAVDPTCTTTGLTEGSHCSECTAVITEQKVIPVLGHEYTEKVIKPTCGSEGYTQYTCIRGDHSYQDNFTTIDSTAHVYGDEIKVVDPTCTMDGYSYKQCTICETMTKIEGSEKPALNHDYKTEVTAPTCVSKGYTTYTCKRCDYSYQGDETEIDPMAHKYGEEQVVDPTCTTDGYTYRHCSRCDKDITVEGSTTPALQHDYNAEVTAPTCVSEGYTTYTCKRGDHTYKGNITEIDPNAHEFKKEQVVVDPTCTTDGYTYQYCERCKKDITVADSIVPALKHDYEKEVVKPTCQSGGYTIYTCKHDKNHTYKGDITEIDPNAHEYGEETVVEPTCTTKGYSQKTCKRCNATTITDEKEALDHDYKKDVTEPTCTEQGYTIYTCARCEYNETKDYVDPKGHDPKEVRTEPTCTEDGKIEYICKECGKHTKEDTILAKLNHDLDEGTVEKEPKCEEQGLKVYRCKRKDCNYSKEETIGSLSHDLHTTVTKEATCEGKGEKTTTCSRCDFKQVEEIAALSHKGELLPGKEATCTEDGLTEGVKCSVCDKVLTEQKVIEALDHDWSEANVTKEATCTQKGEEKYTCKRCSTVRTKEIDMLSHTVEIDPAKEPTYENVGWTEGSHCSVCKKVLVEQEKIPRLIRDWESFISSLKELETYAKEYASENPGKDATKLMINYIRTGVERYQDEDWMTMAGAEETVFVSEVQEKDKQNGTHASSLRGMGDIKLPNGNVMDFGHLFGALNVSSYHNYAQTNTDFGSWVGDICDLMAYTKGKLTATEQEAMIAEITEGYFLVDDDEEHSFGISDLYADMDCFYIISRVTKGDALSEIFENYYVDSLSEKQRAAYFLNNRFPGSMTKEEVRESIYTTYKDHVLAQLLEAGRELSNETELRYACSYTLADYLFNLAKDDLVKPEEPDNPDNPDNPDDPEKTDIYSVFSSTTSNLAPGVVQKINYALDSNKKQMVYYTAEIDLSREDLNIYANYNNNDASTWAMAKVSDQVAAAQKKHSNPEDKENYIPNYNAVVSTNATFYDMSTGEPTGLFTMGGVTYKTGNDNFFAILKDGTPIIARANEYNYYKDEIQEAVGGGIMLVEDGKNLIGPNHTTKMPRCCVGLTAEGKVILMVLDGHQNPYSGGANYYELAQIMIGEGCVIALELDGGGSATFNAKQEGSDEVTVVNRPSDRFERSVSGSLLVVSTAETSKEFDHAVLETKTDYLTVGSTLDISLTGVGAAGNKAEVPEGAYLRVSDETIGSIEGNTFKALDRGEVTVELVLDDKVVGSKTLNVILKPNALKFANAKMNAVYGEPQDLMLQATYNNIPVTINENDVLFELSSANAGKVENFAFIGNEESGVKTVVVTAKVKKDVNVLADMTLRLYSSDESIFDFDNATAGNESLAWNRVVSNTDTLNGTMYYRVDPAKSVDASYTFALDMKSIKAPARLKPLMEYLSGFAGGNKNASPWDYLLTLANRVSPLTNVTIQVRFPENVDVDITNISFVNDYFNITKSNYDEKTRILTMVLNWEKQNVGETGIDPATADSVGILNGIVVTPKFEGNAPVSVTLSGDVTYDIYLDTSQLHSFAQNPANQETYGIYDYVNPDNPEDAGGHFRDTYITFEDNFTVDANTLNGWISDDTNLYYYVNGKKITGKYYAPGYDEPNSKFYYDFGEDGVCLGKVTGIFELNGNLYYAINGEYRTGWQLVTVDGEENYYYFDLNDGSAKNGVCKLGQYTYTFEDYKLVEGEWVGDKMIWAGSFLNTTFKTVRGKTYYFDDEGHAQKGLTLIHLGDRKHAVYLFADDYTLIEKVEVDGAYEYDGKVYYLKNGIAFPYGLVVEYYNKDGERIADKDHAVEAVYYYIPSNMEAVKNCKHYVSKHNDLLEPGVYPFDEHGRYIVKLTADALKNGLIEENGQLYYYVNDVRQTGWQLIKDGEEEADYYFDPITGAAKDGVSEIDGYTYTFENHKLVLGAWDGDKMLWAGNYLKKQFKTMQGKTYYFDEEGHAKTGAVLVDIGDRKYELYIFGEDRALVEQVKKTGTYVDGDKIYYLKDGVTSPYGLVVEYYDKHGNMIEDKEKAVKAVYYYVPTSLEIFKDGNYYVSKHNDLLESGIYPFDENGRYTVILKEDGLVEEDGKLYYYIDGVYQTGWQVVGEPGEEEYYYFDETDGSAKDGVVDIDGYSYTFEDNKLVLGAWDGDKMLWAGSYLKNQFKTMQGKTYCFDKEGHAQTGGILYPIGNRQYEGYIFGEDYTLIEQIKKTGTYEYNGNLYYFKNGVTSPYGLVVEYYDEQGNMIEDKADAVKAIYYYVPTDMHVIRNCKHYVSKHNNLLEPGVYPFDENGQYTVILKPEAYKNGLSEENGSLYYYLNGERQTGWKFVEEDGEEVVYYFDLVDKAARDGVCEIDGYTYTFENYKLVNGAWDDNKMMWAGSYLKKQFKTIQGKTYYFDNEGYAKKGVMLYDIGNRQYELYIFGEDYALIEQVKKTGTYEYDGKMYYLKDGVASPYGLVVEYYDGEGNMIEEKEQAQKAIYYYVPTSMDIVRNCKHYVSKHNDLLQPAVYPFNEKGQYIVELNK